MSDNVVKFRRPEKQPEPKPVKVRGPMPVWLPFVLLLALAVGIYLVQSIA
jgi:hypothetical protein